MDQLARVEFMRALIAMAWADGTMTEEERAEVERDARELGLDAAHMELVCESLAGEFQDIQDVRFDGLSRAEREELLRAARSFAWLDRRVDGGEREVYRELKRRLRLDGLEQERRAP